MKFKSGKFTQQQFNQSQRALNIRINNLVAKNVISNMDAIFYGIYHSLISSILSFPF